MCNENVVVEEELAGQPEMDCNECDGSCECEGDSCCEQANMVMPPFEIPPAPAFEVEVLEAPNNTELQTVTNDWLEAHKEGYGIAQVQYVPAGDNHGIPAVFILYQNFNLPETENTEVECAEG